MSLTLRLRLVYYLTLIITIIVTLTLTLTWILTLTWTRLLFSKTKKNSDRGIVHAVVLSETRGMSKCFKVRTTDTLNN